MRDLLAARAQMAMSLPFHIVFACVGVAMPHFMAIAEWRFLKTGNVSTKRSLVAGPSAPQSWFAVGAVSGTPLELGLLCPRFMK